MGNGESIEVGPIIEKNLDETVKVLIRIFKMSKRLNIGLIQAIELYNEMMKDENNGK